MLTSYQQADAETVRRVVLEPIASIDVAGDAAVAKLELERTRSPAEARSRSKRPDDGRRV